MRPLFLMLAAVLLMSCARHRHADQDAATASFLRRVTAVGVFSKDLPSRYRRVQDTPGWTYVLWSHERLCVVDGNIWIRTHVGDHIDCEWRSPRG